VPDLPEQDPPPHQDETPPEIPDIPDHPTVLIEDTQMMPIPQYPSEEDPMDTGEGTSYGLQMEDRAGPSHEGGLQSPIIGNPKQPQKKRTIASKRHLPDEPSTDQPLTKLVSDQTHVLTLISTNMSQIINGQQTLLSTIHEILGITKKHSEMIHRLVTQISSTKSKMDSISQGTIIKKRSVCRQGSSVCRQGSECAGKGRKKRTCF
jgi:hypothetical protein